MRQHACNVMGLVKRVESSDEMIVRGPLDEASAAKIKGGDAVAMEDFMSPWLTNRSYIFLHSSQEIITHE